ncbi:type II toxin-antitoxin system YafQ family toxin, partial [Patescibacteria group bacterium]|nr:type II toxin-antitoxin system YafQ family toxin [Patescibacteria group bacterium]
FFNVHPLKGKYKGTYELHIESDLLLVYKYSHDDLVLHLIQIGSHSELFE